jgi:hypothetical protein
MVLEQTPESRGNLIDNARHAFARAEAKQNEASIRQVKVFNPSPGGSLSF